MQRPFLFHCTKNEDADLVTFTEEILNGKLHFLCSVLLPQVLVCAFYALSLSNIKLPSYIISARLKNQF